VHAVLCGQAGGEPDRADGQVGLCVQWTTNDLKAADSNAAPGMFTAIQEQLGLKMEAVKAPAEVLVVDHAERPSAD
jgi:uncharacterized protein (TIGR03435 family)